jgi:hypothetical protein
MPPWLRPWPWNNSVALEALLGGGFGLGAAGAQAICLRLPRVAASLWLLASTVGGAAFAVAAALAVVILATLLRESFIAPAACALGGVAYGVATATWIVAFSDATASPP